MKLYVDLLEYDVDYHELDDIRHLANNEGQVYIVDIALKLGMQVAVSYLYFLSLGTSDYRTLACTLVQRLNDVGLYSVYHRDLLRLIGDINELTVDDAEFYDKHYENCKNVMIKRYENRKEYLIEEYMYSIQYYIDCTIKHMLRSFIDGNAQHTFLHLAERTEFRALNPAQSLLAAKIDSIMLYVFREYSL